MRTSLSCTPVDGRWAQAVANSLSTLRFKNPEPSPAILRRQSKASGDRSSREVRFQCFSASALSYSSAVTAAIDALKPSFSSDFPKLIYSCKDLKFLLQIHAQLITLGVFLSSVSLRIQLVNSYSSFHRSDFSLSVFNSFPNPSIVLWNSMIRAYTRGGDYNKAIQFYHVMLQRCLEPDKYTFTFVLKACAGALDSQTGALVHDEIKRRKLQGDAYISTTLVDLYCKVGMVESASKVFDEMPEWDVVSWNAMIAGFSQNNQPRRALELFMKMQYVWIKPNAVTFLNLFPAVCELSDALLCRSLHGFIARRLLLPAVANCLIDAYSKCGITLAARRIFDGMSLNSKDGISWATMISGYCYNYCFADALVLFDELGRENVELNQVSVLSALSAAAETGNLEKGKEIHMFAVEKGMDLDISITTMLVIMYVKCGEVEKAKYLFDIMLEKDIVAWSAMISTFAQSGHPNEAVSFFEKMISEGIIPNGITIVSIAPACADLSDLNLGKSVHCVALKSNINLDGSVGTALVAMYAQCGSFISALNLFHTLQNKDVVTWNSLINGYAQIGDADNAMQMFCKLHLSGIQPDHGSVVGVLSACAFLNKLYEGTSVHGLVIKKGFEADLHVKNASIDMYAKCGDLTAAETIFCATKSFVDVISWNIMIAGYMHSGLANGAIAAFFQMRAENIMPNLVTLVSIIPTAACLSSLRDGLTLHSIAIRIGFHSHMLVGNSLIDMYSKCGRLDLARNLFDQMDSKDIVSWNAMLAGYAMHGIGESAINLFSQMKGSCIRPDSVSLVGVLSACRHGGLVDEGRNFFNSIPAEHCLEPNKKHYACMVDLLGRAGHFDEAWELIRGMPEEADASIWGALLCAAKIHSNVEMGELAVEHLVKLEPQSPSHYVILANIYANLGRWSDAGMIRGAISRMYLSKSPGCSWVEIRKSSLTCSAV